MRRRIAEGQLGAIEQIATRRQSPFPARISDVGVVKDLATHDVDLAAWVAGAPYESIYARTSARSGRAHEDMMVASGVLAGGILVNHLVNWLTPYKDRTTIVTGERGALVADTAMGDLTFYENGHAPLQWDAIAAFRGVSEGQVVRYALTKREPLALEHERFRDAILGVGSRARHHGRGPGQPARRRGHPVLGRHRAFCRPVGCGASASVGVDRAQLFG